MDRLDLLEWQGNRCWTCDRSFDRSPSFLDHEHYVGLIRGWLCPTCNMREGINNAPNGLTAEEREAWTWNDYRRNPPARQLGIVERYDGLPPLDHHTWDVHDVLWAAALLGARGPEDIEAVIEITGADRVVIPMLIQHEEERRAKSRECAEILARRRIR